MSMPIHVLRVHLNTVLLNVGMSLMVLPTVFAVVASFKVQLNRLVGAQNILLPRANNKIIW